MSENTENKGNIVEKAEKQEETAQNNLELQKIDEEKQELINQLNRLAFFSDQIRFNAVLYEGISLILEKISELQEKIDGIKAVLASKSNATRQ